MISLPATMVRMMKRGRMVTHLPVGETFGICCSSPIVRKKMLAYLGLGKLRKMKGIGDSPPELLEQKPW